VLFPGGFELLGQAGVVQAYLAIGVWVVLQGVVYAAIRRIITEDARGPGPEVPRKPSTSKVKKVKVVKKKKGGAKKR